MYPILWIQVGCFGKVTILDPSRKIIGEQTHVVSVPAGQSAAIPVTYTTTQDSPLGIYHIDYILYDSSGKLSAPGRNGFWTICGEQSACERVQTPRPLVLGEYSAEQFVQGKAFLSQ